MCNYEKYAMRREREKKEKRNEEINAVLLKTLQCISKSQSLQNLFSSLTFVVGTANVTCVEKKSLTQAAF